MFFPSNQMGSSVSGDCWFFCTVHDIREAHSKDTTTADTASPVAEIQKQYPCCRKRESVSSLMVPPKHVLSCSQSEIISKIPSDFLLGQHRTIEREIAVSKKEPAEASPSSFGEAQSDCQRRAGSQNEIRQSE